MEVVRASRLRSAGPPRHPLHRAVIVSFLIAVSLILVASGEQPSTLTTLHAVHSLSKSEAGAALPVSFEGTVTYYNRDDVDLFVQEGSEAVYVEAKRNQEFVPGDRVLVRGRTRDSFHPDVLSDSVTVLQHGPPLKAVQTGLSPLLRAQLDCMLVAVRGRIRSADVMGFGRLPAAYLELEMDGGEIDSTIANLDGGMITNLLDAEVELTGVVSGKFDSKMQLVGVIIEVSSPVDIRILSRPRTSPDLLPFTSMDEILSNYYVRDLTRRVKVKGTITYYQPGSAIVLQDGSKSLWISTHATNPMQIGDIVEATGFPDAHSGYLSLRDGEIWDSKISSPIAPRPSTWRQLAVWNSGDPDGHQNDLVSFEGTLAAAMREDFQDEFVLASDGKLFTAVYSHPRSGRALASMRGFPVGATVRVSGICMALQATTVASGPQEVPFSILLRSLDDISVITPPPPLNVRNLLRLVALLMSLLFVFTVWAWLNERKVRRQNAESAYIELRRSRILEEINGSQPIAEIVEKITELVSFQLRGSPCWCDILGAPPLGNRPVVLDPFHIMHKSIHSQSGQPLATIYAALDRVRLPAAREFEALSKSAALVGLAIETRRLYDELIYRSKFDLLTDIHNRLSLGDYLDEQIEHASQDTRVFGLVYIDLNDFKQVNDQYGHQIGDSYLQEAAIRMKLQLREADMLARLGGDEFAALLPAVRTRDELAEIAHRLEACLDISIVVQGYEIHSSASIGIALFPEDGATKEALLGAADAAMYAHKHKRQVTEAKSQGSRTGGNSGGTS